MGIEMIITTLITGEKNKTCFDLPDKMTSSKVSFISLSLVSSLVFSVIAISIKHFTKLFELNRRFSENKLKVLPGANTFEMSNTQNGEPNTFTWQRSGTGHRFIE